MHSCKTAGFQISKVNKFLSPVEKNINLCYMIFNNVTLCMTNSFNLSYDRVHPSGWWHMECGTLFGTRGMETSLCEEPSQTWLLIQTNSSSYKTCRYSAFKSLQVRKLLISSKVFVKFAWCCKLINCWYWSCDCFIREIWCENYMLASNNSCLLCFW